MRPPAPTLHGHAADDLRFIRDAMARSSAFTAVPGWGGVLMGISAIVTAVAAGPPSRTDGALASWLAEGVLGFVIGLAAIWRKARRADVRLPDAVMRRFLMSSLPSLLAGGVLTLALVRAEARTLLPACWLLTYGAAVTSAGAHSLAIVPVVGLAFMLTGLLSLAGPAAWGHWFLAAGFGGLHVIFGWYIARRHGG